jgi:hypothetical protein
MGRQDIEQALLAVLEAVPGVENVRLGKLNAMSEDGLIIASLTSDGTHTQVWEIYRKATQTSTDNVAVHFGLTKTHKFRIEGHFGYISGESEPIFQDLIDAIISAFDNVRTLNDTAWDVGTIQLLDVDYDSYSIINTAHVAVFEVEAIEYLMNINPG